MSKREEAVGRIICVTIPILFAVVLFGSLGTAFYINDYPFIDAMGAKDFVLQNPGVKIQINGKGKLYDRHTDTVEFEALNKTYNDTLFIQIGETSKEVPVTRKFWEDTGINGYHVRQKFDGAHEKLFFKKIRPSRHIADTITPKPKENKMELTLGTWILLIIVMMFVAKIAHKISLRTVFRPTKKLANHVKTEWDES